MRRRRHVLLRQLPAADVAPAPEAARPPARRTVYLDRDWAFGNAADGAVGRIGEVCDLHVVDPHRHLGHFASHAHADGVPLVALPGLDPRGRRLVTLAEARWWRRGTGRRAALSSRATAPASGATGARRQLHAALGNH